MPLAYHAEEELRTVFTIVGLVASLAVVAIVLIAVRRVPEGDGDNRAAQIAFAFSIIVAVASLMFWIVILPAALISLIVSFFALSRVREEGRKGITVTALAIGGLTTAWVSAAWVACIAVGCFH